MKNYKKPNKCLPFLLTLLLYGLLGGCATTVIEPDPRDPWEPMNRGLQTFNDTMDEYLLEPAAKGYVWIMPSFASTGVSNFFSNIRDIKVTINDVLQFKLKQGGMDAARFLVNTTVGIAGFIDVATMIHLPKHDEDFGQTLGYWGVPTGPYLVLPFFGPSSVRGTTGRIGDAAMNPLTYTFFFSDTFAASAISFGLYTVDVIDRRAGVLGLSKTFDEAAGDDKYEFIRDSYLQRRAFLVSDGVIPDIDEDVDLDEETLEEIDQDNDKIDPALGDIQE